MYGSYGDLTCHFEKVESYYSLHISALLDHADASLEEGVEGGTLEHAVLQQGEVDELMYDIVVLSVIGYDVVALLLLVVHGLLGVLQVVLLFLGDLLGLLLVLRLVQNSQSGFLSLQLCQYRLQCLGCMLLGIGENLLYELVVAVEHDAVAVGHLSVEVHACLELAHGLHASHILVLSDEYGLVGFAQGLYLYEELCLVELRHL